MTRARRGRRWSFGRLSEIQLDEPRTWKGRIFLTFDVDFASDDVLEEAVRCVARSELPATWFTTHDTPVLDRIRAHPGFELGVHPDFERLLWRGTRRRGDAESILDGMLAAVPDAVAVRSHCLTRSSILSSLFAHRGLAIESNAYLPFDSGLRVRPFRHFAGHLEVPFGWIDDVAIGAEAPRPAWELPSRSGVNVFVFHPVHVVANPATPRQLERILAVLRRPLGEVREALRRTRRPAGRLGARDHLEGLMHLAHG